MHVKALGSHNGGNYKFEKKRTVRERGLSSKIKGARDQKADTKGRLRYQQAKHLWRKELIFEHRELSESEAILPVQETGSSQQVPPFPAQRGFLFFRTVQSHCLVIGISTGNAICLLLL